MNINEPRKAQQQSVYQWLFVDKMRNFCAKFSNATYIHF